MIGMAMSSAKLFFQGKLFKDNRKVMLHFGIGAGLGILAGVVVGQFAPIWVATAVAGGVAGFAQPFLLKQVKYA
ncbi:MAG: hypothetical protein U1E06_19515 [Tabrizicola sp.]|uniref:hypothetical protein n=1 Tax=Tabrizicola sp. TaxID=2005166 RepID=UPI002734386B|nr:hypothetical protein [Tabrizicola sp.]MDP3264383.1 hypothetical protein [Tabrizicola sp.]MDP3648807.1 hypothetical protein [Paracoccaceae bacterium]MDZ4068997.1 hypothetical protein [Tabrizicola sp.]